MRKTTFLAGLIVLAPLAATAHVVRHSSVPQVLQGTWQSSAEKCQDGDKNAIVLSAKSYASAAGNCTVDYVSETASPRGPIYSARLLCSETTGSAQKRSATNLIIRPDGTDRISVGAAFGSLVAYQRCPVSAADKR
jgi:hypothetical protein